MRFGNFNFPVGTATYRSAQVAVMDDVARRLAVLKPCTNAGPRTAVFCILP